MSVLALRLLGPIAVWTVGSFAAMAADTPICPLPDEHSMVAIHLYFGRAIKGREPVTNDEWAQFAANVLSQNFPDGFTVDDGDGVWRDPRTGREVSERTKIVTIATQDSRALGKRIRAVSDAYRSRFHQESVGVITEHVCAAF